MFKSHHIYPKTQIRWWNCGALSDVSRFVWHPRKTIDGSKSFFIRFIMSCLLFVSFRVPIRLCIAVYEEIIALVLPCENESLIYGLVCFIENFSTSRVPWSTVKSVKCLVFLFWQIRLMMLSKKHKEAFKLSVKSEFQQ